MTRSLVRSQVRPPKDFGWHRGGVHTFSLPLYSAGSILVGNRSKVINKLTKKDMSKMTKSAILNELAEKTGLKRKEVQSVIDGLVELAYKQVKTNGVFPIHGIGKLVKVNRKARMGRNPATGAEIKIPAKTVVKFRVAKAAKEAVL